jgi:hypothetical protein
LRFCVFAWNFCQKTSRFTTQRLSEVKKERRLLQDMSNFPKTRQSNTKLVEPKTDSVSTAYKILRKTT